MLSNFELYSEELFGKHNAIILGERHFIKEIINVCEKINFKSLFVSNNIDEVLDICKKNREINGKYTCFYGESWL